MWVLRVAGGAAVGWNRKWSSWCLRPLCVCGRLCVCVCVGWTSLCFHVSECLRKAKFVWGLPAALKRHTSPSLEIWSRLFTWKFTQSDTHTHTHTLWSVLYYMRRLNRRVNWAVVQTAANKKKGPPRSEWGTASWVSCCWETLPIQPVSVPSKSQAPCRGVKETPEVTTQTLNFKSHSLTLLRKYLWLEGLVGVWRISAFQLFVLLCSHPRMYEQGNICPIWT